MHILFFTGICFLVLFLLKNNTKAEKLLNEVKRIERKINGVTVYSKEINPNGSVSEYYNNHYTGRLERVVHTIPASNVIVDRNYKTGYTQTKTLSGKLITSSILM